MDDIRFERHFRTPYSEGYYIMHGDSLQSNSRLGTVDIHFTSTTVHGTLILEVGFYSDEYFAEESNDAVDFDDGE